MKKILFFLGFFFLSVIGRAQTKQEYAIYDSLLVMHPEAVPAPATILHTLKYFNFKDLTWHDFNPKDSLTKEWKLFFNSIDISSLQPGQLDADFLAKYPKTENRDHKIRFSPIIISPDQTKAVCGADIARKGENVYLFEKKGDRWRFRRSYFVSVE